MEVLTPGRQDVPRQGNPVMLTRVSDGNQAPAQVKSDHSTPSSPVEFDNTLAFKKEMDCSSKAHMSASPPKQADDKDDNLPVLKISAINPYQSRYFHDMIYLIGLGRANLLLDLIEMEGMWPRT